MFESFIDDKPFICTNCGETYSENAWNDGDVCDGCFCEVTHEITELINRKDNVHQFKKFKKI